MENFKKIEKIYKDYVKKNTSVITKLIKKDTNLKNEIENFWNFNFDTTFKEKIYYYLFKESPFCPHGVRRKFFSYNKGYYFYSSKCKSCKLQIMEKMKKKNVEKYGTPYLLQSDEIRKKIQKTCKRKYGSISPLGSKNIREKIEKTNLMKYGSKNTLEVKEIREKIIKTNKRKYGVDNPIKNEKIREKIKITNLKKYGEETPLKSKKVREKIQETNLIKYGFINPFQSEEIKNKIKRTNIKIYGTPFPSKNKKIKEKIKKTCLKKYGVENPMQSEQIKNKIKKIMFNRYGVDSFSQRNMKNLEDWNNNFEKIFEEFNGDIKKLSNYFNVSYSTICNKTIMAGLREKFHSTYEKEIHVILNKLGVKFTTNNKSIIKNRELDIYLNDYNVALEFNGNIWHSEIIGKKGKYYHLEKTIYCEERNIRLIHFWEYLWIKKKEIYISMLKNILGKNEVLNEKDLRVVEITKKEAQFFTNENSFFNFLERAIHFGLRKGNNLVCLLSVTKENSRWNIENFFYKKGYVVENGLPLILHYFSKKYSPKEIYVKVDRSLFTGNTFFNNNFYLKHIYEPEYFVTNDYINYNNIETVDIDKLDFYDTKMSKWKNLQYNGYDRIWNCGYLGFSLKLDK